MPYKQVLVPLDGSQLAEYILPQVWEIAGAYGSSVLVMHVVSLKGIDPERLTPSLREAKANITKYLQNAVDALERKSINAEWRIAYGDPVAEIVRHARSTGTDLILMSTHGQGGKNETLGSVGAGIVSSGVAPVMLVRPPSLVAGR